MSFPPAPKRVRATLSLNPMASTSNRPKSSLPSKAASISQTPGSKTKAKRRLFEASVSSPVHESQPETSDRPVEKPRASPEADWHPDFEPDHQYVTIVA